MILSLERMCRLIRSGIVTLVGKPNTGKSSLINAIFQQKVVIVSDKPQTTWHQIRCVYTDETAQIVFTDTPGLNKPVGPLGKYMTKAVRNALEGVDLILWLFDCQRGVTEAERYVYDKIQSVEIPIFAVLNKIDLVRPKKIEKVLEDIGGFGPFAGTFQISAKNGDGLSGLIEGIRTRLKEGGFLYDPEVLIDKPIRFMISELIREKIYRFTSEEIPYETGVFIEHLEEKDSEGLSIRAEIFVSRDNHKGILIGKGGKMIQKIRLSAKKDIEYLFDRKAELELYVRVKERWMHDENLRTKDLDFETTVRKSR
ncbi:MAG TPA: GTPase Era [Thermotogota bacterium]|nr:GTPase Era [Thermotogota bacterium]MDD8040355.1 GTPase Era [Thermotogota bacterium]HNR63691.1 GTPase Era [Thermotogota bacterium]HNT95772.1 GTPase Era [Thermotogota bacterium]HOZ11820.1 GTPase Era [Thermotogota bacterium]